MINLLPGDLRSEYLYARRNVVLRKWLILFAGALVGLCLLATYGLVTIQQNTKSSNDQIQAAQKTLAKENYSGTQAQVKQISGNFRLVIKVLNQEVLFDQLLKQIATSIPATANLTGLNITQTKGSINISADATDYNAATQVQVNLSDPANKIFAKADITSISCGGGASSDPNFPCVVNLTALFAPNNPYLFINSGAKP